MPIPTPPVNRLRRSNFRRGHRTLAFLAIAVAALAAQQALADSPWSSSSMGWGNSNFGRAVPTAGWSSWEATTGGTFGSGSSLVSPSPSGSPSPRPSHHSGHTIPAIRMAPPPHTAARNREIDPVMLKAASIAEQRALPHGTSRCWHYVKEALVAAGSVTSYPQTAYAKDAGRELVDHFGFVRLSVRNPEDAPVGAVVVYGGAGAGHVEMRTPHGYASDYRCPNPSFLPFIGAYARVTGHHHNLDTAQLGIPATPGS